MDLITLLLNTRLAEYYAALESLENTGLENPTRQDVRALLAFAYPVIVDGMADLLLDLADMERITEG